MNTYLKKLLENPNKYISNSSDIISVENINNNLFILTDNSNKNNTFTTSFATMYLAYPYDELKFYFNNIHWFIRFFVIGFFNILLSLINLLDFGKAIYVNNLCLSTNLYENSFIDNFNINDINYEYPIIIRSIYQQEHIKKLELLGFKKIISRKIYILDPNNIKSKHKKYIKEDNRDLQKFINLGYTIHYALDEESKLKITDQQIERFKYLYDKLYLDKYSKFNPQFTTEWIKLFINLENTGLIWLEDSNHITQAVFGYYIVDNYMTIPLFGYNTDYKLYTSLSYLMFQQVNQLNLIGSQPRPRESWGLQPRPQGCRGHFSGGVGKYKKQRGAIEHIEYNLVYYSHLPFRKKISYIIMTFISNLLINIKKNSFLD